MQAPAKESDILGTVFLDRLHYVLQCLLDTVLQILVDLDPNSGHGPVNILQYCATERIPPHSLLHQFLYRFVVHSFLGASGKYHGLSWIDKKVHLFRPI